MSDHFFSYPAPLTCAPPRVVLDTDFGAGLQFLRSWTEHGNGLHYLACLARPITMAQMRQQHDAHPELADLAQLLRMVWPAPAPGFHRLLFGNGRIALTLMIGALDDCLTQCVAQVQTFYVDSEGAQYARKLSQLALPGASLKLTQATPSDALIQAGFVFASGGTEATFMPRRPLYRARVETERRAVVIGAGLAGAAMCDRLAARGWQITLLERHAEAAQEASGNLAGIMMPVLSKDDNPTSRLMRAAYLFALQRYQQLGGEAGAVFDGEMCGVLQLAHDAADQTLQQEIARRHEYPPQFARWLSASQAGATLGMATPYGGWLFAQGGWAHPAGVCRALLAACGERLTMRYRQHVHSVRRDGDSWSICDAGGVTLAQAPVVIFANGNDATQFAQLADLPLLAVRGQVTHIAAETHRTLPLIVCRDGYLTRPSHGISSVGATYDDNADPQLRRDSQAENLQRLQIMLPDLLLSAASLPLAGRVGFRCVSPDRLPLVGALPSRLETSRIERLRDVPRWPGLHAILGYASRGLIWAPLAAELLAAQLDNAPLPLEKKIVAALDPGRFQLQAMRRRPRQAC